MQAPNQTAVEQCVYFEPQEKMAIINQFMITYVNVESVTNLLNQLISGREHTKHNKKVITVNDSHLYVYDSKVIFDMKLVTELQPIEMELDDAIEHLRQEFSIAKKVRERISADWGQSFDDEKTYYAGRSFDSTDSMESNVVEDPY